MATRNPDPGDKHESAIASHTPPQIPINIATEQLRLLTSILEKVDRRLTILEERLLAGDTQANKQSGFPQFLRLPIEIRLAIWELAIPRRLLTPWKNDSYDADYNPTGVKSKFHRSAEGLAPPVISRVCRESRSVARRRGKMFLLSQNSSSGIRHSFSYWTWFDAAHDVVQLHDDFLPVHYRTPVGLWNLVDHAVSITMQARLVDIQLAEYLYYCSCLQTINIQMTAPEIAHRLRWHPEAIMKLMGLDSFFMLDLEDLDEVERVKAIMSLNPKEHRNREDFEGWLYSWRNLRQEEEEDKENVLTKAQRIIKDTWLKMNAGKITKKMPKIRLVYIFEKDDGSAVSSKEREIPVHPCYRVFEALE